PVDSESRSFLTVQNDEYLPSPKARIPSAALTETLALNLTASFRTSLSEHPGSIISALFGFGISP
ncbi:hypothetical protein, partial [Vibrio sp. DNB22_12_1]